MRIEGGVPPIDKSSEVNFPRRRRSGEPGPDFQRELEEKIDEQDQPEGQEGESETDDGKLYG